MCAYQTLFHDDNTGYVVRCAECEKIQLGFRNLVMTFARDDFDAFRWWLHKVKHEQRHENSPSLRCILIPTPCDGMRLLLSARELNDFDKMLEEADSELRSLELLRLFNEPS